MKKQCFKCGEVKALDCFYGHKGTRDGRLNKCKSCTKEDVRANSAKVGSSYDFSEKGIFRVIYKTQKRNQKLRGHGDMPYSKDDLIEWCRNNGFDQLFEAWKLSGNKNNLKPSVDRIDDFKGYSLDNIQLGTWRDNRDHQASDIMSGNGVGWLRCKAVIKMDLDFNVIHEYVSYNSAQRDVGHSVEYAIKNQKPCKSGFRWKYKATTPSRVGGYEVSDD